uniref:Uncharacterized protein n=1 Tax=Nelumbo nucifera TaxID=4432 RepID=A0A822ZK01_NELNU|nr:TPA_asm: hypothetical protein HUJ06_002161 [Nelumbo nucifera]
MTQIDLNGPKENMHSPYPPLVEQKEKRIIVYRTPNADTCQSFLYRSMN